MHTTSICYIKPTVTIWDLRIVSLVKVENILWTKLHAAKCVIQSFSSLITGHFMKTIIGYRWKIEDAVKIYKYKNINLKILIFVTWQIKSTAKAKLDTMRWTLT